MDYFGNRHGERFIFKRVSPDTYLEHGSYDYITEGSLELSTESDLVVTGSFSFEGYEIPDTKDLIRIYYRFTDDFSDTQSHPLATLFTSYSALRYTDTTKGLKAAGTLEGQSVLTVLQEDIYGAPFIVTRNTNPIYKAQQLIREHGLLVEYEPSSYVMSSDQTFDAGTDFLEIVKWLVEAAGYVMYPDEMGVIQLKPYDDLQRADAKMIFKNDKRSIMYPELEAENSLQETPNVYKLLYNVDTCCMLATARNLSGSRASLDARGGRAQVKFEETGELPEKGNRLENLMNKAVDELKKASADVEYVTMTHAWVPLYVYDQVKIQYADLTWQGGLENVNISLKPATETQSKIKRVLYDEILIDKTGEYLRGDDDD